MVRMGRTALGSSSTAFLSCAIASSTFPARAAIPDLMMYPAGSCGRLTTRLSAICPASFVFPAAT